ncbi:MAG: glucosaminidase domain-containing protein [bacterium]|nr:glucosaminidase domain-containing protein [bacterium]MDY4098405.1 glucosaminidase domain-containing protein [Lachnospiraceae bacterium]
MRLVQSILTKNPCYMAGRKITVKGLMLHSVGCPQPRASVFINSWNSPSYSNACVHGFIDGNDGTVYQTLPWNHRGWHCGSGSKGSGNNTHIGVEMCEPACIKYTGGSSFTCSDKATAKAVAKRTYEAAVELFAMLCKQYNLNPTADGVIISHREGHSRGIASNHGDPEHLWNGLGMGYTMDGFRKAVKAAMDGSGSSGGGTGSFGLQASALKNFSESDVIAKVGPLFTADQKTSGILASVSLAQFILESGYGKSELAQNANNCFGMKKSLSGNTWGGSAWDGTSIYTKKTQEYENGAYVTVSADFRKYPSVEKSIADHSAYLLGAKNGAKLRYDGLKGCTDYKKTLQIIKDGGYATSPTYVENLCSIIEKWKLTQYDVANAGTVEVWYHVRKTWADAASQKGAFHSLANAKKCADENAGYSVFDESGKNLYTGKQTAFQPYLVKVSVSDLRIRKGPGTDKAKTGKYTGEGIFTIVEEADGPGASRWGLLKAYQKNRDGWISLDYAQRV